MAKYEYPAGVLPDIEMYGGDTTKWKIPLKRPSGAGYSTDLLEGFYCALTITPFSMAQNSTQEPVIIKNSEITNDGMGGSMAEFEFEISDTIGLSGKYVYQIELYSEDQSRSAQGYLYIKKNNNPYRVNLEYSDNTGTAGSGSSIVGGFRTPIRGVDYWTNDDKHEIIAAVVVVLQNSLEDDTYGIVEAVMAEAESQIQALTPVRGTDYWTTADQNAIKSDVITDITPTIQALKPVRGTDYWTTADQNYIKNAVITAVQPQIAALAPVKGTDYWTSSDIAAISSDVTEMVSDATDALTEMISDATDALAESVNEAVENAVAGLVATVSGHTLMITSNPPAGSGT